MKESGTDFIRQLFPDIIRRSYALKLAAIFILLGIILGTIGVVATYAITEDVEESSNAQFAETASQESRQIESWLQNYYNIGTIVADDAALQSGDPEQISQSFRSRTLQFPSILGIHYVDTERDRIVASTNPDLENGSLDSRSVPWTDELNFAGQRHVSSPYTSRNVTRLAIAQRTERGADRVLVLEVETRVAAPVLGSTQADLDTGYIEVVTRSGQVLFSERPSRIGTAYRNSTESRVLDTASSAGVAGTTLTDENPYIRAELGADRYLAGYARVEGTDWVVVKHARRDTVYGFAQSVFVGGIVVTGAGVVLVGLVGVLVGRQTSADIDRLVDKANEMEQGNLTVDFTTGRIDNIGRLYAEFDRTQQALRKQIEQSKLIEHSYDLITVIDPTGLVEYQSPSAKHIVGLEAEEFERENIFTEIHEEDTDNVRSAVQRAVENPQNQQRFEFRIQNAAAEWRYFEAVCENHLDDPFVDGLVLSSRDVTEREEREAELRDREQEIEQAHEQLRQVIDLIPDPLYAKNIDDEILLSNAANAELLGTTTEGVEGRPEPEVMPDVQNYEQYRQRDIDVIETGTTTTFEERLTGADGETHIFQTTRIPFRTAGTDENAVLGYAREVTDLKEYEQELERVNTRLRLALEETDTGVWEWDLDTDEVIWDETSEQLFGYDTGAFPGTFEGFADRVHDDDLPAVRDDVETAIENNEEFRADFRVALPDGDQRWLQTRGVVRYDEAGEATRMIGIQTDITERKERERAAEQAQEQLRQIVDLVPDPLYAKNIDDEILLSNEANAELHGTTPEEMEGQREREIEPDVENIEDFDPYRQREVDVIETGDAMTHEEELTDPDGERHVFRTTRIPFEAAGREEDAVLGYARDVTDLKEYERKLERSHERIERTNNELETLNRILRHDIRNDVVVMSRLGDELEQHVDDEGQELLDQLLERGDHIRNLTTGLRDLMRTLLEEDRELRPVRLDTVVESEVREVTRSHEDAVVTMDDIPRVHVRANQMLSSVFRNILENAIRHNDSDVPEVAVSLQERDDRVAVRIADNGPGVPEAIRDDIFGKGEKGLESKGTGIGLYLVSQLLAEYGGDVWVEDNDPRGAVFVVELVTMPPAEQRVAEE